MKTRYLYRNKHGVYCLRFELQSKPKNTYRQLLISLRTKEPRIALQHYSAVMPEVYRVLCNYSDNLRLNVSEAPNVFEVKRTIRELVARIVETEKDPSISKLMSQVRYRKLDNYLDATFESLDLTESQLMAIKRKLSISESRERALVTSLTSRSTTASPASIESHPIGELVDDYFNFKRKSWGTRTATQALSNLVRFAEIIDFEYPSAQIDGKLIQHYVNVMTKLPKNAGKRRKEVTTIDAESVAKWWLDLSVSHSETVLGAGGLEKHFSDIRMFIKWLHERHYVSLDFSKHLEIAKPKGAKFVEKRAMYDTAHISKIFSSYIYGDTLRNREAPKSYHFWAPLIALHTGMRISEIASLEVQDVCYKDGVLVFSVNDEWKSDELKKSQFSKSKKTKDSLRNIPVADAILNAGLLEFIGKRKSGLLFDDLNLSDTKGLGNTISKWYNEAFVKYAGIPKRNEKNTPLAFHSFRHTFTSLLDKTTIEGQPLRRNESFYITGHSDDSVRTQTYNHGSYSGSFIKAYIDAIDFGIDWKHVSFDKFLNRKRAR